MKIVIAGCIALLAIGNEVTSLIALTALCCIGLIKLFSAMAEGGAFD